MITKSISMHLGSKFSIEHNNRKFIADNVNPEISKNNHYFVAAGEKTKDGNERFLTLKEIFEKVFEDDFQEYQKSIRPSRRYNGTYLQYLRENEIKAKEKGTNNAPHIGYEYIAQIGCREDTGLKTNPEDSKKAGMLLDEYCKNLMENNKMIHVLTTKELRDENFKLPDCGLILCNLCTHYDEVDGTNHAHVTVIPYCKCSRGPKTQALMRRTFDMLGYKTEFSETQTPKIDRNGNVVKDENGQIIHKKYESKKGALDFLEEQKTILEKMMLERYGWIRAEKKPENRSHLETLDYKKYAKKKELQELESKSIDMQLDNAELQFSLINDMVNNQTAFSSAFGDKSKLWDEYRNVSGEFWGWYKEHKNNYNKEYQHIKENKNESAELKLRADYYRDIFFKSANLIAFIAFVVLRIFQFYEKEKYQKKLRKLLQSQKELKKIAKSTSSEFAKLRTELKSTDVAADRFIAELQAFQTEFENDYYKMPEYEKGEF